MALSSYVSPSASPRVSPSTSPHRRAPTTPNRASSLPVRPSNLQVPQRTQLTRWSEAEICALVEGVVTFGSNDVWPTHHKLEIWNTISFFIKMRSRTSFYRSGEACRFKVVGYLKKKFKTPSDADTYYRSQQHLMVAEQQHDATVAQGLESLRLSKEPTVPMPVNSLPYLSSNFSTLCSNSFKLEVPEDFLILCVQAMRNLKSNGRANVVYNVAKGFGTERADGSDTRFPIKRMPMGLIEYMTNFFVAENINQIPQCPSDYRSWQVTMYSQFGQKWAKLHHGPLWSVGNACQVIDKNHSTVRDTMEALVNIPSISEATLRRDIAASNIFPDSKLQLSVLDEAKRVHPNSWWWIKADACDLVAGLGTSVEGKWSGDANMHINELEKSYESHCIRLKSIKDIGIYSLKVELFEAKKELTQDIAFVDTTLKAVNLEYNEKFGQESQEKRNLELAWDLKELADLNMLGRQLLVDSSVFLEKIDDPLYDKEADNFPSKLSSWKQEAESFVQRLVKYKRTAATHALVVLISPEERSSKPYALAVQCIAYKNVRDSNIRLICNEIVREMTARGMKVSGFTTNGEFNSLRSKGNTRPLSIFEVRSCARNKVSKWSQKNMIKMLSPRILLDGSITAEMANPAVSDKLLKEILVMLTQGWTRDKIIDLLRSRCVPNGYIYHTWRKGISETLTDKLKSILAQLEYQYQINKWEAEGVPFRTHMHVPEIHPITGTLFCEREDEGHVLKRIGNSLRQGRAKNLNLERFVEALQDKSTGLTYPALTGIRKQSVEDVERFFGLGVIQFMEAKGYSYEARYLKVVRNWRRAVDERGLSEDQRQQFSMDFFHFIAQDLIPWYSPDNIDFSNLEVNRPTDDVRGLTRETIIALAADIESRNWRRDFLRNNMFGIEHPRASTTDDVECFFSVLRDMVGKDFTLKQVYYGWRKVCLEFLKKLDPDLPFYYHTSSHSRFYEGEMPSFNETTSKNKPKRLPQRELLGTVGRYVSLPVRGSLSVRAKFHNIPVELPPLPNSSTVIQEHSYCKQ